MEQSTIGEAFVLRPNFLVDLEAITKTVREEFLRELPSRLERIRAAVLAMPEINPMLGSQLKKLATEAHKLSGSAATFGYDEIAYVAKMLRKQIELAIVDPEKYFRPLHIVRCLHQLEAVCMRPICSMSS